MKKRGTAITCLTVAALALSLSTGVVAMAAETPSAYEPVESLSFAAVKNTALRTDADREQNPKGPSDYSVDGKSMYVLNTATNAVYEYQGGKQAGQITLDDFDIIGTKLAAKDDVVYVLDNNLSVVKFENNQEKAIGNLKEDMDFDNAVGFNVTEDYTYASEPTREGGRTLRYVTDANTGELRLDRVIEGYMVDDNTFYQSKILGEDGQIAGPTCVITIRDANGHTKDTITLKSEHDIAGAQYLGKNQEGMHIVKQIDMISHADGTCSVEETVRTVDADDKVLNCEAVETNIPSMDAQVKVQDGEVYRFQVTNIGASVDKVNTEELAAAEKFSSRLENKEEAVSAEAAVAPRALTRISRSEVMSDARAYHTSFSWTCASRNLTAMTNWRAPHYVTGAGTYTCMPYCWGGFNTTAQYRTGISNGGHVGNLYTGTGAYVANTYGLDCSGYVSRCWRQSTKYGTSTIGNICSKITYSALKAGDALNKSGSHIALFDFSDGAGTYALMEETTLNNYDRVANTGRSVNSLNSGGYVALRYNGITD